jgi:REP element-mobilizing transposase RayT
VEIPPHIAVSDFVRRVKGRSSHQVQMEFPVLRKRYWHLVRGLDKLQHGQFGALHGSGRPSRAVRQEFIGLAAA